MTTGIESSIDVQLNLDENQDSRLTSKIIFGLHVHTMSRRRQNLISIMLFAKMYFIG